MLMQTPSHYETARSLFKYSILYLMLLCAGMGLDSLPVTHQLTAMLTEHLETIISAMPSVPPLF
jgi:protoheme IX farnesyltransferase